MKPLQITIFEIKKDHWINQSKSTEVSYLFVWVLIRHNYLCSNFQPLCSRGVYLLHYLRPIPHCWETNITSLPLHLRLCLVADRCLVFMNILCPARPRCCAERLWSLFQKKVLYVPTPETQWLAAFAVVNCWKYE